MKGWLSLFVTLITIVGAFATMYITLPLVMAGNLYALWLHVWITIGCIYLMTLAVTGVMDKK